MHVPTSGLKTQHGSQFETIINITSKKTKRMSSKLDAGSDDEHDDEGGKSGKGSSKSRRELPAGAVATLKAWLLSPEHFTHPYPTPQDQIMLMQKTGIDKKQLKNWFTNARRRIWKPMLKKQIEQGKLTQSGAPVGGSGGPVQGLQMVAPPPPPGPPDMPPSSNQSGEIAAGPPPTSYPQSVQSQPQQSAPYDNMATYGQSNRPGAPQTLYGNQQQCYPQQQQQQYGSQGGSSVIGVPAPIAASSSIGQLAPMATGSSSGSSAHLNKTDSHAVLMELFARDQDLVRQATESAKLKAAAAATKGGEQQQQQTLGQNQQLSASNALSPSKTGPLDGVPAQNSWPRFSSISSLNNLGSLSGVRSVTSMGSGADLVSSGTLNKMGSLAQVKSIENMNGRNDSYAFLEVFFGERSASNLNLTGGKDGSQRGIKREREEDNDVGLSLDADESPSTNLVKSSVLPPQGDVAAGAPQPASLPVDGKDNDGTNEGEDLKLAYNDALAARGLISVSRSCEKLTDLELPAKMQRTLSQEYLRQRS